MKHINNILVPVDFSDESINGLIAAVHFAEKVQSKIHLAHFLLSNETIAPLHPKEAILGRQEHFHRTDLENKREIASTKLTNMMETIVPEPLRGHKIVAGSTLKETFESCLTDPKLAIDLVITGNYGSEGIVEFFTGNKIDQMVRRAEVPIIVVNSAQDLKELKTIFILTDLGDDISVESFKLARWLKDQGSTLYFVNIITTELIEVKEVERKMTLLMSKKGLAGSRMVIQHASDERSAIQDLSNKLNVDLILMKTYEKSDLMAFLGGSMAEDFIGNSGAPLFIEKVQDN